MVPKDHQGWQAYITDIKSEKKRRNKIIQKMVPFSKESLTNYSLPKISIDNKWRWFQTTYPNRLDFIYRWNFIKGLHIVNY